MQKLCTLKTQLMNSEGTNGKVLNVRLPDGQRVECCVPLDSTGKVRLTCMYVHMYRFGVVMHNGVIVPMYIIYNVILSNVYVYYTTNCYRSCINT